MRGDPRYYKLLNVAGKKCTPFSSLNVIILQISLPIKLYQNLPVLLI